MINNLISAQYSLSALVPKMASAPASTQPPSGILEVAQLSAQRSTASASEVVSSYGVPPSDSAALLRAQLNQLEAQLRSPVTSTKPAAKIYATVQGSNAPAAPRLSELA